MRTKSRLLRSRTNSRQIKKTFNHKIKIQRRPIKNKSSQLCRPQNKIVKLKHKIKVEMLIAHRINKFVRKKNIKFINNLLFKIYRLSRRLNHFKISRKMLQNSNKIRLNKNEQRAKQAN